MRLLVSAALGSTGRISLLEAERPRDRLPRRRRRPGRRPQREKPKQRMTGENENVKNKSAVFAQFHNNCISHVQRAALRLPRIIHKSVPGGRNRQRRTFQKMGCRFETRASCFSPINQKRRGPGFRVGSRAWETGRLTDVAFPADGCGGLLRCSLSASASVKRFILIDSRL